LLTCKLNQKVVSIPVGFNAIQLIAKNGVDIRFFCANPRLQTLPRP
jgi:hypothetical protein